MTVTASRRRKQSIALTMLLVWLLALALGVANACMTEVRGAHAHTGLAPTHQHHHDAAQNATHGHADEVAGVHAGEHSPAPAHQHHPDKQHCQKNCDESAQSILKSLPKLDLPDLQAFGLPTSAWDVRLLHASAGMAWTHIASSPPPGPPPRVRFSRLAL
jgi:hypothetical protein